MEDRARAIVLQLYKQRFAVKDYHWSIICIDLILSRVNQDLLGVGTLNDLKAFAMEATYLKKITV